jgi:hypothetical protein
MIAGKTVLDFLQSELVANTERRPLTWKYVVGEKKEEASASCREEQDSCMMEEPCYAVLKHLPISVV